MAQQVRDDGAGAFARAGRRDGQGVAAAAVMDGQKPGPVAGEQAALIAKTLLAARRPCGQPAAGAERVGRFLKRQQQRAAPTPERRYGRIVSMAATMARPPRTSWPKAGHMATATAESNGAAPAGKNRFDTAERERIRAAILRYMEAHRIGVPTLQARIAQAADRSLDLIPLKTLQRFLAGATRTNDAFLIPAINSCPACRTTAGRKRSRRTSWRRRWLCSCRPRTPDVPGHAATHSSRGVRYAALDARDIAGRSSRASDRAAVQGKDRAAACRFLWRCRLKDRGGRSPADPRGGFNPARKRPSSSARRRAPSLRRQRRWSSTLDLRAAPKQADRGFRKLTGFQAGREGRLVGSGVEARSSDRTSGRAPLFQSQSYFVFPRVTEARPS